MGGFFSRIFGAKKHSSQIQPQKKAVGSEAATVDFAAACSVFKNLTEAGMSEDHACTITAKYMSSFTGNITTSQKLPADEDKKVFKTGSSGELRRWLPTIVGAVIHTAFHILGVDHPPHHE